jgi:hypothetical protein
LGRVEVAGLPGDRVGLGLADLPARQGGVHAGQVVTQPPGQQHPLLALVGAGADREGHLGADRHRPRRPPASVRWCVLGLLGGVGEVGGDAHLRRGHGGLDPLQRLELVQHPHR